MGNVNLKINGLNVTAPAGSTILEAAQAAGIKIFDLISFRLYAVVCPINPLIMFI